MRALAADVTECFRAEGIDLHPEHVDVGDCAENFEIAFGLRVEIEIEEQADIGSSAVAERFEMNAQIAQNGLVDVQLRVIRRSETRPVTARLAVLVDEDVGLAGCEAALAHLAADCLDAVEIRDRGLVIGRMIDAPSGAMR